MFIQDLQEIIIRQRFWWRLPTLWLFQIKSKKLTADANMPQVLTLEQYSKDEVESGNFLFLSSQQRVILLTEN